MRTTLQTDWNSLDSGFNASLIQSDEGNSLVEYALLLSIIASAVLFAVTAVSAASRKAFQALAPQAVTDYGASLSADRDSVRKVDDAIQAAATRGTSSAV